MSEPIFKIGDLVTLKSGGPWLMVAGRDGDYVCLAWFDENDVMQKCYIPPECLQSEAASKGQENPESPTTPIPTAQFVLAPNHVVACEGETWMIYPSMDAMREREEYLAKAQSEADGMLRAAPIDFTKDYDVLFRPGSFTDAAVELYVMVDGERRKMTREELARHYATAPLHTRDEAPAAPSPRADEEQSGYKPTPRSMPAATDEETQDIF